MSMEVPFAQPAACGIVKLAVAELTEGHPLKNASTYHWTLPPGMSVFSCGSFVIPTSSKGAPFTETQTRNSIALLAPVHVKVTGLCVCPPLIGEVGVGAEFAPQFAPRPTVKCPVGERIDGHCANKA